MPNFKKACLILVLSAFSTGMLGCMAPLPEPLNDKARPASTSERQFSSIVSHVDAANRTVTLSDEDGNEQTYLVSRTHSDLSQVKAGDRIVAEYSEDVVLVLEPVSATASGVADGEENRQRVVLGDNKSDERRIVIATLPAAVESLDASAGLLRVQDPEGRSRAMVLNDRLSPQEIKPGDLVLVTFTESIKVQVLATR